MHPSIFISGTSLSAISKILNDEMINIIMWLAKIQHVSITCNETNYMIMTNQGRKYNDKHCVITIDGEILSPVSNTKFLGVILDDKLTWKNHIDYMCFEGCWYFL